MANATDVEWAWAYEVAVNLLAQHPLSGGIARNFES